MQCCSVLHTEENSDVVILQVFANLLVDHDSLNQVFVAKSVQKNTGLEGLAWNPPWLNAQYCIIEYRGHSTQLTEWWGAGIQVHQTQGDMKATSDSDMVYVVTAVDPKQILFQCLVYIVNLMTVVETTWSYLTVVALISKMLSDAWGDCGHAVHQSGGVHDLGIGLASETARTRLFVYVEMVKISTVHLATTRGGRHRNRCDAGHNTALREITQ